MQNYIAASSRNDDDQPDARMEENFWHGQENPENEDVEPKTTQTSAVENDLSARERELQQEIKSHPLAMVMTGFPEFKLKAAVGNDWPVVKMMNDKNWQGTVQDMVDLKEAQAVAGAIESEGSAEEKEAVVQEKVKLEMQELFRVIKQYESDMVIIQPDSASKIDHLSALGVDQCFIATGPTVQAIKAEIMKLENFDVDDTTGMGGYDGFKIEVNVADGIQSMVLAFLAGKEKGEVIEEEKEEENGL